MKGAIRLVEETLSELSWGVGAASSLQHSLEVFSEVTSFLPS
jgi:hypothetical protein